MTKDRISELEERIVESIQAEQQRKHRLRKHEQSLRNLQDNSKRFNTCIIGVSERELKEYGDKRIFEETMVEISKIW